MDRTQAFAHITRLSANQGFGLTDADWDVLEEAYRVVEMAPPPRPPRRIVPTINTPLSDYPNAATVKRQYSLD